MKKIFTVLISCFFCQLILAQVVQPQQLPAGSPYINPKLDSISRKMNELDRKLLNVLDSTVKLKKLLASIREKLEKTATLSEMDKFDLQQTYQDYQKGVQNLLAIMKALYEEQKRLLENLRG